MQYLVTVHDSVDKRTVVDAATEEEARRLVESSDDDEFAWDIVEGFWNVMAIEPHTQGIGETVET